MKLLFVLLLTLLAGPCVSANSSIRIAVLDFEGDEELTLGAADLLEAELYAMGTHLLERRQIRLILGEQNLWNGGSIRADNLARGNLPHVDLLVAGKLAVRDNKLFMNLEVLDSVTGMTSVMIHQEGEKKHLGELVTRGAAELVETLPSKARLRDRVKAEGFTQQPEIAMLFYRGMEYFIRDNVAYAVGLFNEARQADKNFWFAAVWEMRGYQRLQLPLQAEAMRAELEKAGIDVPALSENRGQEGRMVWWLSCDADAHAQLEELFAALRACGVDLLGTAGVAAAAGEADLELSGLFERKPSDWAWLATDAICHVSGNAHDGSLDIVVQDLHSGQPYPEIGSVEDIPEIIERFRARAYGGFRDLKSGNQPPPNEYARCLSLLADESTYAIGLASASMRCERSLYRPLLCQAFMKQLLQYARTHKDQKEADGWLFLGLESTFKATDDIRPDFKAGKTHWNAPPRVLFEEVLRDHSRSPGALAVHFLQAQYLMENGAAGILDELTMAEALTLELILEKPEWRKKLLPQLATLRYRIGLEYMRLGDTASAVTILQRAAGTPGVTAPVVDWCGYNVGWQVSSDPAIEPIPILSFGPRSIAGSSIQEDIRILKSQLLDEEDQVLPGKSLIERFQAACSETDPRKAFRMHLAQLREKESAQILVRNGNPLSQDIQQLALARILANDEEEISEVLRIGRNMSEASDPSTKIDALVAAGDTASVLRFLQEVTYTSRPQDARRYPVWASHLRILTDDDTAVKWLDARLEEFEKNPPVERENGYWKVGLHVYPSLIDVGTGFMNAYAMLDLPEKQLSIAPLFKDQDLTLETANAFLALNRPLEATEVLRNALASDANDRRQLQSLLWWIRNAYPYLPPREEHPISPPPEDPGDLLAFTKIIAPNPSIPKQQYQQLAHQILMKYPMYQYHLWNHNKKAGYQEFANRAWNYLSARGRLGWNESCMQALLLVVVRDWPHEFIPVYVILTAYPKGGTSEWADMWLTYLIAHSDERIIPQLVPFLQHPLDTVRQTAATSIANIPGTPTFHQEGADLVQAVEEWCVLQAR